MGKAVILLALILVYTTSYADWAIKGEGNFNCPEYVAAKRGNTAKLYSSASWVQGFISGVNYQAAKELGRDSMIASDYPATSIVDWLERYCRENPQDYLSDAAEALVLEFDNKDREQTN